MRLSFLLALPFGAALACAQQPDTGDFYADERPEGPVTNPGTSPPSANAGGGGAHPPASPPVRGDAGGHTSADAGTDAGRGLDPTSIAALFPAIVGHSWTFDISSDFSACRGTKTGSVLQPVNVDGRNAVL